MSRQSAPTRIELPTVAGEIRSPSRVGSPRYPGSPPFQDTETDRLLFRGRADQADELLNTILSTDLTLLYSVSGLGKTSLLNAGVLNELRARSFWPVVVRLNDLTRSPLEIVRQTIIESVEATDQLDIAQDPDAPEYAQADRLWDLLSGLEIWRSNSLLEPVLILDQFEELFTLAWDADVRRDFITQFGEVVRRHRIGGVPRDSTSSEPPSVKIVMVMREDHLGELESMAHDVPQIMRHRIRLAPLDRRHAEAAIREPALVESDELRSPPFQYTDDALDEILDFLESREAPGSQPRGIDPSQLQLVCQYVEETILPGRLRGTDVPTITVADLGGRAGLEKILGAFYGRVINSLEEELQSSVRELCEAGLISENGRRLSLEEGEIAKAYGVSPETLRRLVELRLLRVDARVGSFYYELAHDTLVEPMLSYRQRKEAERIEARSRKRRRWAGALAATAVVAAIAFAAIASPWNTGDTDVVLAPTTTTLPEIDENRTSEQQLAGLSQASSTLNAMRSRVYEARVVPGATDLDLDVAMELIGANSRRQIDQLRAGLPERMIIGNTSEELRITASSVGSNDGSISIRVSTVTPVMLSTAGAGSERTALIESAGDVDVYALELDGDDTAVVEVTAASQGLVAAVVETIDPDGVVSRRDPARAGLYTIALAGTGRFLILVRGEGSSTGGYSISAVGQGTSVELPSVGAAEGQLTAEVSQAVYTVSIDDDEIRAVEVIPEGNLNPAVQVTDRTGSVSDVDLNRAGEVEVALLNSGSGEYQVSVRSAAGGSAIGQFRVAIAGVETDPLEIGVDRAISFAEVGAAVFVLDVGPCGEAVSLETDDGQVQVQHTDPDGTISTALGGDALIELGNVPGQHRLTLTRASLSPGTTRIRLLGAPNSLDVNAQLRAPCQLRSPNLQYRLEMQTDGNLVLYDYFNSASPTSRWDTMTSGEDGAYLTMQDDGNLVLTDGSGTTALFASKTNPNRGAKLTVEDSGAAVVRSVDGGVLWFKPEG